MICGILRIATFNGRFHVLKSMNQTVIIEVSAILRTGRTAGNKLSQFSVYENVQRYSPVQVFADIQKSWRCFPEGEHTKS